MAGQLDHAAFRREVAAQDGDAAARLERLVQGADHFLPGRFDRIGRFLGESAAGDGHGGAIHVVAFHQALGDYADAAGLIHVGGHEAAAGLEIDEDGSARADVVEIVDGERHFGLARHGQQVQHGVGGAAGGGHAGDGVLERLAGADVARADVLAHGVHDDAAAAAGDSSLRASTCGTAAVPMGARPISSITVAMVLAVNWPPQAPAPGQAWFSISSSSSSEIRPAALRAHGFEHVAEC